MIPKGDINKLRFFDSPSDLDLSSDARIEQIDCRARTKLELLDAIASALRFPEYFGRNWDSLWECIRDLSWIEARIVVMMHSDIPRYLGKFDLSMYLHILANAAADWKPGEGHELVVAFPTRCRGEIDVILRSPPDEHDRPSR